MVGLVSFREPLQGFQGSASDPTYLDGLQPFAADSLLSPTKEGGFVHLLAASEREVVGGFREGDDGFLFQGNHAAPPRDLLGVTTSVTRPMAAPVMTVAQGSGNPAS